MVTTAIFPSRYVQGKGALTTHLPQELAALGHKALILQDPVVHSTYRDAVATALHGVIEFDIEVFSSECSDEEIARISARAQEIGADVIVGMGGGGKPWIRQKQPAPACGCLLPWFLLWPQRMRRAVHWLLSIRQKGNSNAT